MKTQYNNKELSQELVEFINTSPSAFHSIKTISEILEKNGYKELFEGENFISHTNSEIFIGNSHNAKNVYKKEILLSIDSDKINGALIARNRMAGDKIYMGGMHKSLKKLMCDKKIPIEQRDRIPVLCDDNGIVAVPFIGIRDDVKCVINKNTKYNIYFYLY